jgi:DNA-binding CsgD family transcriptional regulator
LLASGHTNHGIAELLSISVYSVKKHVSAIIEKLYARNRAHAAAIAVYKGLVRPTIIDVSSSSPEENIVRRRDEPKAWEKLTARELEILMLLGEPRAIESTNEALAQELTVTRNTLRKHLRSIYKKLNVKSRAGLVGVSLEAWRIRESEL